MPSKIRLFAPVAAAAAASALLALVALTARAADIVRVSGTGAGIGGMQLLAAVFVKTHPGVTVRIVPGTGSSGGIKAVIDGKLDAACSSRPLRDEERAAGLTDEPYARTALIFGTQPSNPATGLTLAEIVEIYRGNLSSWPDGRRIRLALRPPSDAFTGYLAMLSPNMPDALERSRTIPGLYVGATDQDAADYIERTPGSFGPTTLSLVLAEKRDIKPLSIGGALPTDANVVGGKYPCAITLRIVSRTAKTSGKAKEFIDFVFSKEAARILSKNGHIPAARGVRKP